jgi:hypothetical protein
MPTLSEVLSRNTIEYYDCVKIDFGGSEVYYYTTCPWDITVGGDLYLSSGPLISIGSVEENAKFDIDQLDIVVAGLVPMTAGGITVIQHIQSLDYINKEIQIQRAFIEDSTVVYSELTYLGYINTISASVTNKETTVMFKTSNHWANFERLTARYTNNASQKAFFPTDSGFRYSKDVQKEIVWATPE